MISVYILRSMAEAKYKLLSDGTYFGEIPTLAGVWAEGKSLEVCRDELREVLEEWLVLKLRHGEYIPNFDLQEQGSPDKEYA